MASNRSSKKSNRLDKGRTKANGLGEALEFLRLLWKLDHALRLASKSMESRLGVTGPQRLVIRLVGRFPSVTAGDLAALMHLDPSSLTSILNRLEQSKLVTRRVDRADRRRTLISLTARGRTLDRNDAGTVEAAVVRALESRTPGNIAKARDLLHTLALSLSQPAEGSDPG